MFEMVNVGGAVSFTMDVKWEVWHQFHALSHDVSLNPFLHLNVTIIMIVKIFMDVGSMKLIFSLQVPKFKCAEHRKKDQMIHHCILKFLQVTIRMKERGLEFNLKTYKCARKKLCLGSGRNEFITPFIMPIFFDSSRVHKWKRSSCFDFLRTAGLIVNNMNLPSNRAEMYTDTY